MDVVVYEEAHKRARELRYKGSSFEMALAELFLKSDLGNAEKLVKTFPNVFLKQTNALSSVG